MTNENTAVKGGGDGNRLTVLMLCGRGKNGLKRWFPFAATLERCSKEAQHKLRHNTVNKTEKKLRTVNLAIADEKHRRSERWRPEKRDLVSETIDTAADGDGW